MIPRARDSTTGGESDTTLFKDLFRKEAFLNVSDYFITGTWDRLRLNARSWRLLLESAYRSIIRLPLRVLVQGVTDFDVL